MHIIIANFSRRYYKKIKYLQTILIFLVWMNTEEKIKQRCKEDQNAKPKPWFNSVFELALIPQDEVIGIWGKLKNSVKNSDTMPKMWQDYI